MVSLEVQNIGGPRSKKSTVGLMAQVALTQMQELESWGSVVSMTPKHRGADDLKSHSWVNGIVSSNPDTGT